MAKRPLENTYELPNASERMDNEQLKAALTNFDVLTSEYMQIVNKQRKVVPFRLNSAQRYIFNILWPMIDPKTRLERHRQVVIVKGRQVGASVSIMAFINYICAFASGIEYMTVLHILPVSDTIQKLTRRKVEPIITGVHPDIFPRIERDSLGASIVYNYENILGIPRHNHYELVASSASSIRGDTVNVAMFDECLTPNVEILTDQGFKRFDELNRTERVAQFDLDNRGISFVKPLRYIEKDYDGDAYEWTDGNGYSFVSTAFHNFVVGRNGVVRKGVDKHRKFDLVEAHAVHANSNYNFPRWGLGVAEHSPLTAIERLGIAVQADGSVLGRSKRKSKTATARGDTRCRVSVKRPSKIARMQRLLREAGIAWTVSGNGRGYTDFVFSLPFENPKLLPSFLSPDCSYQRAREIIHEVLMWDGYGLDRDTMDEEVYLPRASYYSSIVKENRDFVAAVALQAGLSCSAGVEVDDRSEKFHDVYRLNMTSRKEGNYGIFKKKAINYNGKVYCVTVPTGAIVVKTGSRVWVCGNCSYYRNPDALEDIVGGALPDQGFSLSVFFSTYGERQGDFFRRKLLAARDNPEEMDLIFVPWFLSYPEQPLGTTIGDLGHLSEYEEKVIIPAMRDPAYNISEEDWADKILWYRRKSLTVSNMKQEFPTSIDEVIAMGENKCVFSEESIKWQEEHIELGTPYSLLWDPLERKVVAHEAETSSFTIFRQPQQGHSYISVIDPIVSENEDSDFFAMSIFDTRTLEQVATFRDRNMPIEDYAEICVSASKLYNNSLICPEQNMGEALLVAIRNLNYYYYWYVDAKAKAAKKPGLRTTMVSKAMMLEKMKLLLDQHKIILHDKTWVEELGYYEKKASIKSNTMRMMAKKGKHDDTVTTGFLFCGTLRESQLLRRSGVRFGVI